jgi:hypothetical protein
MAAHTTASAPSFIYLFYCSSAQAVILATSVITVQLVGPGIAFEFVDFARVHAVALHNAACIDFAVAFRSQLELRVTLTVQSCLPFGNRWVLLIALLDGAELGEEVLFTAG